MSSAELLEYPDDEPLEDDAVVPDLELLAMDSFEESADSSASDSLAWH